MIASTFFMRASLKFANWVPRARPALSVLVAYGMHAH
jgi:hypothetical protein